MKNTNNTNNTIITTNNNTITTRELDNMKNTNTTITTTELLSIDELHNALEVNEYARDLVDYSGHQYICDAVAQIADNCTSIYYHDIINFIANNVEEVGDTISEIGWDGCGGDLYKAGQLAEYLHIEREINNNLEDALKHYALELLKNTHGLELIPADEWDNIEAICEGDPAYFDEIEDACNPDNWDDWTDDEDDEDEGAQL